MSRHVIIPIEMLAEWPNMSHMLEEVFAALTTLWPDASIRITDFNRTPEEDAELNASGVHSAGPPWRALDISIFGLTGGQEKAEALCDVLNSLFYYDPQRPTKPVAYAKPHGTGPHIHLQAHPRTRRKDPVRTETFGFKTVEGDRS